MSLLGKTGQSIINNYSQRSIRIGNGFRSSYDFDNTKLTQESFTNIFRDSDPRNYINEANQIMIERMKHKGSSVSTRSLVTSVILKDSKKIGLHNYMIENLREKRTEVNLKVQTITKALKDSGEKLDYDFKDFVEFVEQTKREQKSREEELGSLKINNQNLSKKQKIVVEDYKKNMDDFEKTIKILSILKSYGSFVHRVLGIPFSYSKIPDMIDNKEKQYDHLAHEILKDYDKMIDSRPSILEDESLLLVQFIHFEDKVIKIMENKHIIDKELIKLSKIFGNELKELESREKNIVEETQRVNEEKNQIINLIKNLKTHTHNDVEENLGYIIELGIEINGLKEKGKKRNFLECLNFTRNTLDILSEREKLVNSYIKEIEQNEITDEQELRNIVGDRKKTNKREKQMMVKIKQDQQDKNKRQRAEERAQRFVIKGRMVPKDYPILKLKMKQTLDKMENKNDDYSMLYY